MRTCLVTCGPPTYFAPARDSLWQRVELFWHMRGFWGQVELCAPVIVFVAGVLIFNWLHRRAGGWRVFAEIHAGRRPGGRDG